RYLSAAIWSGSLCCSIEPESPAAFAGPWAFSRIVSSRLSAIGSLPGQRGATAANGLKTRLAGELTNGRPENRQIVLHLAIRRLPLRWRLVGDDAAAAMAAELAAANSAVA